MTLHRQSVALLIGKLTAKRLKALDTVYSALNKYSLAFPPFCSVKTSI